MTVKSEGVSLAAKHLHISQPSLSSQLKVLEESLQIKLFHKIGRKNELTQEGTMIYAFCRKMFEISELMHESIEKNTSHSLRRIYIGCSNQIPQTFISNIVNLFLADFDPLKKPRVTIVTGEHDKLVTQLKFREIDILLSQVAVIHADCENINNIAIPVKIVCKRNKKNITFASFMKNLAGLDMKWALPSSGMKLRNEINSYFEDHSLKGSIIMESDILNVLLSTISDEHTLTFLPTAFLTNDIELKHFNLIGPKEGFWKHRIWLASHKINQSDTLVTKFSNSFSSGNY